MDTLQAATQRDHGKSEVWADAGAVAQLEEEQRRLGARLRILRRGLGLNQRQAAERARLSQDHISRIETGDSNVTLASLVALARAYEIQAATCLWRRARSLTLTSRTDAMPLRAG